MSNPLSGQNGTPPSFVSTYLMLLYGTNDSFQVIPHGHRYPRPHQFSRWTCLTNRVTG